MKLITLLIVLLASVQIGRADIGKKMATAVAEMPLEQIRAYFDNEAKYVEGDWSNGFEYLDDNACILLSSSRGQLATVVVLFGKTPSMQRLSSIVYALLHESLDESSLISQTETQYTYQTPKGRTVFIGHETETKTYPFVNYSYRWSINIMLK